MAPNVHRALFLDRDGTLNEEVGFLSDPHKLLFTPAAPRVIQEAKRNGLLVIVVSNQSGVARGLFSETTVHEINLHIQKMLETEGTSIDAFYFCPHYPGGSVEVYQRESPGRKPSDGMLRQASREWNIDLSRSFMVGDRVGDIEAGKRAGCKTFHVLTGYGRNDRQTCIDSRKMDYGVQDLSGAWDIIRSLL